MLIAPIGPRGRAGTETGFADVADVVIPVLNEAEMLPRFLARLEALPVKLRAIFVDNGSTDATLDLLRARSDVTLFEHGENLGYGKSLADGLSLSSAARVVIIDADCEYPPEAIPLLLERLNTSAVVYASRFRSNPNLDMARLRRWGNQAVTALFNLLYGQEITDLYTGMKALRREAFAGIRLTRTGFEHVVELACKLARRGHAIAEVPVPYTPRQAGRSKMSHVPEAMKAVGLLFAYRFRPHV